MQLIKVQNNMLLPAISEMNAKHQTKKTNLGGNSCHNHEVNTYGT